MRDLEARFIVWWRVNVSGRLCLGEFLRFMLEQEHDGSSQGRRGVLRREVG